MKTLSITLGFMLLCGSLFAQDKSKRPIEGLKLFTLQIQQKNHPSLKDTIAAEITVVHKVGTSHPQQTFVGWVVQTGKRKRFYSEAWDPMPGYYAVRNVKEL